MYTNGTYGTSSSHGFYETNYAEKAGDALVTAVALVAIAAVVGVGACLALPADLAFAVLIGDAVVTGIILSLLFDDGSTASHHHHHHHHKPGYGPHYRQQHHHHHYTSGPSFSHSYGSWTPPGHSAGKRHSHCGNAGFSSHSSREEDRGRPPGWRAR
ncbi:MAG: hypothetical protein KDK48_04015 [Chlamydiia bacterium]|nr:hypothetical protein [Chlamydiia bacterium]